MMGIAWDIDGRSTGGVGSVCYASGIVGTRKGVEWLGLVISVGRDRANLSPMHPIKGTPAHQEVRPSQTVHAVKQTTQPGLKFKIGRAHV